VLSVAPDARVATTAVSLPTTFDLSTRAATAWVASRGAATGRGVGVAVVDTGIAAGLPDFGGRAVAAVTNPDATTASDVYGHGTVVAGLVAGAAPPYLGTAPAASLVSIKVSDDHGDATVADAIAGVQYAVDHRADYGIRVVNLSLDSTVADSYLSDPLDAAAEEAWRHGLVVVAAAGNLGGAADAVSYAPANDPYVITVGGVDEHGTPTVADDTVASWSSRGRTEDGFAKPDVVAPGAHIVGPLGPGSDFAAQCPSCVIGGRYVRLSGTSLAAPIVAGIAADLLSAHPGWTPDMVKGALVSQVRRTPDGAGEVAADLALVAPPRALTAANAGLTPNQLLDPATGTINPSRMSWGRASWGRASWGRASWSSLFG
jgi:serine protease AprX